MWLFNRKGYKRMKEAEIKLAEANAAQVSADAIKANDDHLQTIIQELREMNTSFKMENDRQNDIIQDKTLKIRELNEKINVLVQEPAAVAGVACIHAGCALREPVYTTGTKWYLDHKDDYAACVDWTPVNRLLIDYGKKKKHTELVQEGE